MISGGQQQRVAIARALANDPPLIVADEPTGNLDSKTAAKIFSLFKEFVASGKTILMVTHDSDLASRVDRTILISDGEIVNEYLVRALATLTQDQLVEVARRVKPQVFPPDTNIVRQGEVGDKFYILLDGRADVYIKDATANEVYVNQLQRGQYFGEMALLGNGVRGATVKTSLQNSVSVAALDAQAFNQLINDSRVLREELTELVEKRKIYNQLQTISSFNHELLTAIFKDRKSVEYEAGYEIIRQGEVGETFYLLLEGEVDIFVHHTDGTETMVDHLVKGYYFGELALMGNKRRQATARVTQGQRAKIVELTAQDFEQLFGSSDAFQRHVRGLADVREKQIEEGNRQKDRE
jgi:CRP-like cAMP-binding protein